MRLSKIIEILENKAIAFYKKNKDSIPRYILILFIILYAAGFIVHSVTTGLHNFYSGSNDNLFIIDPVKNIKALFTPAGIGTVLFGFLMFLLFSGKGKDLLSGYKTVKDKERGIEILPEGTHGTSGFMDKKELPEFLVSGSIEKVDETLFGKLENGDYVAMKDMPGMSKNVMVYGAPGTGKSRGFVMPFVMQAARRGESLVMVDPKAEFYEMYSGFLKSRGYTVKAYNLLDLFASDGWNCVMDTAQDITLVQRAAEIIIRNTSGENERGDFWEKAEKNLLMALLHYVQTLTYPGTDKLLPPEERSLGTIYKILSTTSVQELDARFRALPPDHPALPPYGIFRQAHKQIWGNIVIGLGNRLNVFQNKFVDDITKHNEIDLTLPGREKCAYFCIISDQDSSLEFLSSMFFSLMFVKLFDYARQQDNRRLPVCVNVLMDEFCNIALLDSKKIFSVARSRNINIQAVVQSIAQLSDRYPGNEWQEIVGDCDYQLFLGCNDVMTSEFFSKQCGEITVRVNNTNTPMRPFLDFLSPQRPYMQNKTSTGRALMLPDEIRRLPKDKAILLVRGAKSLLLNKITPEEHPSFKLLKYCKAAEHIPAWKLKKPEKVKNKKVPQYKMQFEMPLDTDEEGKESFDLSDGIDCRKLQTVKERDI